MLTLIGLGIMVGGILAMTPLTYLGVRWRIVAAVFPLGFAIGGILSEMLNFLPTWAEWSLWAWLGISSYGVLLVIGYIGRPWFEEQGRRW